MITIHNMRVERPINAYDIKVDRSSPLGNPFYMRLESQRDKVCDDYRDYIYKEIRAGNKRIIQELERLCQIYKTYGQLRLFCWCAPKRCHSETIREIILKMCNVASI